MALSVHGLVALVAVCLPAKAKPQEPLKNPAGLAQSSDGTVYLWKAGAVETRHMLGYNGVTQQRIVGDVEAIWPRAEGQPLAVIARTDQSEPASFLQELRAKDAEPSPERRLQEAVVATAGNGAELWILGERSLSKLDARGNLAFIANREPREWHVLAGGILYSSLAVEKSVPPKESRAARCRLPAKWSFEGSWFRYKPLLCGSFVIEPVEAWPGGRKGRPQNGAPRRIRSFDDGTVLKDSAVAMGDLACLPHNQVIDLSTQKVFSLPELHVVGRARCGQGRVRQVASVLPAKQPVACIDTRGKLADMVVSSSR